MSAFFHDELILARKKILARGAGASAVALYRYREISRRRRKYIQRVQVDSFWTFREIKFQNEKFALSFRIAENIRSVSSV